MAPAGLATMTMITSAATSASRSLLIEPLLPTARCDGAVPARGPAALVPFLAQSLEYAHTVGDVSIAAGGTHRDAVDRGRVAEEVAVVERRFRVRGAWSFRWSFRQTPHRRTEP